MWVTKLLISPVKKRIFCPKTTKFSPKLAFLSIAGSFGALLVGWLVVVARWLYLARLLFTLYFYKYHLFHEGIPKKTRKTTKRQRWMENLAKRNVERLEGELGSIDISPAGVLACSARRRRGSRPGPGFLPQTPNPCPRPPPAD